MATSAGPESPLESPLSAIAVCVDGSPSAEHVLRYAFSLAGAASAEKHVKLRIVRVAVPSSPELEDITDDACVHCPFRQLALSKTPSDSRTHRLS